MLLTLRKRCAPPEFHEQRTGLGVPHLRGAVVAAGDDSRTIGRVRDTPDSFLVSFQFQKRRAGPGVPHFRRVVITAGDDPRTIRREGDAPNKIRVSVQDEKQAYQSERPTLWPCCPRLR